MIGPGLAQSSFAISIDETHALLITLWLLISSENSLSVAERFNVTRTCCQTAFANVCQAMAAKRSQFVQWIEPKRAAATVNAFDRLSRVSVPGIVGVIGCTRFEQQRPNKVRIGTCLQAVCDATGLFMDIHLLDAIDTTNASVLASSPLPAILGSQHMYIPPACHLAGDRSYPLGRMLMVPYKVAEMSPEQLTFNNSLATTTATIDTAFSRFRERFGKLKGGPEPVHGVVGDLRRFLETAVSVHNFCVRQTDSYWLDGTQQYEAENGQLDVFTDKSVPTDVTAKRDTLAARMLQRA